MTSRRLGRPDSLRELNADDLRSGRWLRAYATRILISADALLFVCAGVGAGVLADLFKTVESDGESALVAFTAIGFAALAVALTALSIFVSLVNDAYLRILSMSDRGGLAGYIVPYLSAALISSITTIVGAVGALGYDALSGRSTKAILLGLEVGLVAWATWAVFQIVVEVAVHGLNRYGMAKAVEMNQMSAFAEELRRLDEPS
jgi:hypothetical protein